MILKYRTFFVLLLVTLLLLQKLRLRMEFMKDEYGSEVNATGHSNVIEHQSPIP